MQLHGTLWNHASSVITKQSFDSGGTEKKTCVWPQPLHAEQQHFRNWSVTTDISYITASWKFRSPNQLSPFRSNLHKKKRKHISLVTNLHPQQKRNIIISLLTKVTSCILGPKMFVNQNKIGRPYVLRYTPVDEILRYNKKKSEWRGKLVLYKTINPLLVHNFLTDCCRVPTISSCICLIRWVTSTRSIDPFGMSSASRQQWNNQIPSSQLNPT